MSPRLLSTAAFLSLLASPVAFSQSSPILRPSMNMLSETIVSGVGEAPTSIQVDDRGFAYVSFVSGGGQVSVDISCPTAPFVCGSMSVGSDQFFEAFLYKGYLYAGHRFGGVSVMDVFDPCNLILSDFRSTHYHFKGITAYEHNGTDYLVESEHLSGGQDGGLRVFEIGSGVLTEVGCYKNSDRDGNAVIVQWHLGVPYAIQVDSGRGSISTGPIGLNVYDLSNPTTPTPIGYLQVGTQEANNHFYDLLKWNDSTAVLGAGKDGLMMIDIADPTNISVSSVKPMPGTIAELARFNRALLLVNTQDDTSATSSTALVEMCDVNSPKLLNWAILRKGVIRDAVFHEGLTYVVGRNSNGEGILQVWQ